MGKLEFSKILKRIIDERKLEIVELATSIDVPVTTLRQWTVQEGTPRDLAAVKRLATHLSVDFEYLLFGIVSSRQIEELHFTGSLGDRATIKISIVEDRTKDEMEEDR